MVSSCFITASVLKSVERHLFAGVFCLSSVQILVPNFPGTAFFISILGNVLEAYLSKAVTEAIKLGNQNPICCSCGPGVRCMENPNCECAIASKQFQKKLKIPPVLRKKAVDQAEEPRRSKSDLSETQRRKTQERKSKNLGTIKLTANVRRVYEKQQFRMILQESEDSTLILAICIYLFLY
ncbi:unnamed protein product [Caenorhabditis nigoni]